MREYPWNTEYNDAVCETDDTILLEKLELLIERLTERFALLGRQGEHEERESLATAIASLLVLKSERGQLGRISQANRKAKAATN